MATWMLGIVAVVLALMVAQVALRHIGVADPLGFSWRRAWHAFWQGPTHPARTPIGTIRSTSSQTQAASPVATHPIPWSHWLGTMGWMALTAWVVTGSALWAYNAPPDRRSPRAWLDWILWRWPVVVAGFLAHRPEWVHDAWERHWAAMDAAHATAAQRVAPAVAKRAAAVLDASFAISEPDAVWMQDGSAGRVRRVQIAATPRGVGPVWPHGYHAGTWQIWRQWAQQQAAMALYHAGVPGRWSLDAYGFLQSIADDEEEEAQPGIPNQSSDPVPETLRPNGPPLTLLPAGGPATRSKAEGEQMARVLQEALASFGFDRVAVRVQGVGPTVVRLGLRYPKGLPASRIVAMAPDLVAASEGRLRGLRFARAGLTAEVVREHREIVALRSLLPALPKPKWSTAWFPVGVAVDGSPVVADLTELPHLLVGGTTGSGKSVFSLGYLTALHMLYTPAQLRLLLVDPKRVDLFPFFEGSPLLERPVAVEPQDAIAAVEAAIEEMERRYDLMSKAATGKLATYNASRPAKDRLPVWILHIDELYDLRLMAKAMDKRAAEALDDQLTRIAQKGRAAGVHVVVATQKPTVEAVPSILRSNVPSRLAMAVQKGTDSNIILDEGGAELLAGKGDALWKPIGGETQRVQTAFVREQDTRRVVEWCRDHAGDPPSESDAVGSASPDVEAR
ncbi:putative FtsK domain-containing protein [Candidatus Hydrogenisulfobacillus filiaventi]|uniref:Putative FtsK domain-containing protein n=1 Tax=Candidatus Hydrogenisulfobacillus filiaventi TaxID=2707344 RepID=A0A6F8ZHR0_9FIRM|nr:putative FtsK domain-containing protein [Candidatus Hydrogenisulfobacillus filiaventi]